LDIMKLDILNMFHLQIEDEIKGEFVLMIRTYIQCNDLRQEIMKQTIEIVVSVLIYTNVEANTEFGKLYMHFTIFVSDFNIITYIYLNLLLWHRKHFFFCYMHTSSLCMIFISLCIQTNFETGSLIFA